MAKEVTSHLTMEVTTFTDFDTGKYQRDATIDFSGHGGDAVRGLCLVVHGALQKMDVDDEQFVRLFLRQMVNMDEPFFDFPTDLLATAKEEEDDD